MEIQELKPILKTGEYRTATLKTDYSDIVAKVGFKPNATHLDDPQKVSAAWGIEHAPTKRKICIWAYKTPNFRKCKDWSVWGDETLLAEIFGEKLEEGYY